MPPRVKTDFRSGKPVRTYSYVEDRPTSAEQRLDTFIKNNPQGDDRNTTMPGIKSIVTDMPAKFQRGFEFDEKGRLVNPTPGKKSRYFRADGSLNATGLSILADYSDNRPEYSRQMNRFRRSSPEMMQAYASRFPLENFATEVLPNLIPFGIGLVNRGITAAKNKASGIGLDTLSERGDVLGAIARTGLDIASAFTPEQAENLNINIAAKTPITEELKKENILKGDQTPLDPQFQDLDSPTIFDNEDAMRAVMQDFPGDDPFAYDPNPFPLGTREYVQRQEELNRTGYPDYFNRRDNIAKQVEKETEQTVPGVIDIASTKDINISGDPNEETEGIREQIDINTIDPNVDIFTDSAFMGAGPNFPAGGVGDGNSPTGLNFYGGDTAFANTPEGRAALKKLRSDQNQSYINMSGIVGNKADGGSMDSYDNMSTYQKLKIMADSLGQ